VLVTSWSRCSGLFVPLSQQLAFYVFAAAAHFRRLAAVVCYAFVHLCPPCSPPLVSAVSYEALFLCPPASFPPTWEWNGTFCRRAGPSHLIVPSPSILFPISVPECVCHRMFAPRRRATPLYARGFPFSFVSLFFFSACGPVERISFFRYHLSSHFPWITLLISAFFTACVPSLLTLYTPCPLSPGPQAQRIFVVFARYRTLAPDADTGVPVPFVTHPPRGRPAATSSP